MSRTAVVTGGASGMGLSICEQLAGKGYRVGVLDLAAEAAERAAEDIRSKGGSALARAVDVSDRASVDDALDKVRSEFGPIEIMVTSAGIAAFAPFTEITIEAWDRIIAVNLTGTFHCLQAVIPEMVAAKWGRIVTISSSSAQQGAPGMGHYASSKGGVIAMTRTLAREYAAQGITVNTIPPCSIETPMAQQARAEGKLGPVEDQAARIPVGRVGTGDDIAAACVFLCSDEASYITGQVIGVNGGAVL